MENHIEDFAQGAKAARVSASKAEGDVMTTQWLMVAEMWELLARGSQDISRMREKLRQAPIGVPPKSGDMCTVLTIAAVFAGCTVSGGLGRP
jgi:hypothetical protein